MVEKTREFYDELQIDIPDKYVDLAVRSLTMPQYAKEFNDKFHKEIGDHRALATVGDALCEAYTMLKFYEDSLTADDLNTKKEVLQNKELNIVGEQVLKNVLFARNNDLSSNNENENKKAYATAIEAVIGFISIIDKKCVFETIDRIWDKYVANVSTFEDKIQLFKFYGFNNLDACGRFIENIKNGRIPFSNLIKFNDPFESLCFYDGLSNDEEKQVKELKAGVDSLIPNESRYILDVPNSFITNKSIVSCFCKKDIFDEEKTCDLMWAHYANNHNGVLVEYEFENVDFAKNFKSDEGGYKIYNNCKRDYHFSASDVYKKEVEYRLRLPKVIFKDGKTFSDVRKFLYIKPKAWKYEKEVRLIATLPGDYIFDLNQYYSLEYKTECIRAIYFGLNINEENKESILEAIASIRLKCDIYEAYIDENNFYVQYRKYKANENADGRCNVVDERIKTLQISALSRINFCFKELKSNPPMKWENNVLDEDSIEISIQNYKNLSRGEQVVFKETLYKYLNRESTVEARTMLIINYLSALLIEGRNNQISIHKNFENKISEIRKFEAENQVTLYNLKSARDKLYAHIDLDWQKYANSITFDEFEICIKFLNDLFDYRVFD